jgi:hypothetical protein
MSIRIGAGFRLGRHIWIGASVPLGHGRRLARHQGHGERFDPIGTLVGLAIMWVFLRVEGPPAEELGAASGLIPPEPPSSPTCFSNEG